MLLQPLNPRNLATVLLLEIDLIRIFTECGLNNIQIDYTNSGRMPFTPWYWPKSLGFRGRAFSDNILCVGQKS
jgi:hypothetical protein